MKDSLYSTLPPDLKHKIWEMIYYKELTFAAHRDPSFVKMFTRDNNIFPSRIAWITIKADELDRLMKRAEELRRKKDAKGLNHDSQQYR
jgi:hypothetical protein